MGESILMTAPHCVIGSTEFEWFMVVDDSLKVPLNIVGPLSTRVASWLG